MQNGVLNAPHILIHGEPAIHLIFGKDSLIIAGITKPEKIPRGTDKGVHRVRFSAGIGTTAGAFHVHPVFHLSQWGSPPATQLYFCRQDHWQVRIRHGHNATVRAMNHRNWGSPVPLPRDQPIPQAIVDLPFA